MSDGDICSVLLALMALTPRARPDDPVPYEGIKRHCDECERCRIEFSELSNGALSTAAEALLARSVDVPQAVLTAHHAKCQECQQMGAVSIEAEAADDAATPNDDERCPVMTAMLEGSRLGLAPTDEMRAHVKACDLCLEQLHEVLTAGVEAAQRDHTACHVLAAMIRAQAGTRTPTEEVLAHLASCDICGVEVEGLIVEAAFNQFYEAVARGARQRERHNSSH